MQNSCAEVAASAVENMAFQNYLPFRAPQMIERVLPATIGGLPISNLLRMVWLRHLMTKIWVDIDSVNSSWPDSNKPLPESELNFPQRCNLYGIDPRAISEEFDS